MKAPGHQPPELLKMASSADGADWDRLHVLCHDRAMAEKLARALEQSDAPLPAEAKAWAEALKEMHPDLKVNLTSRD